MMRVCCRMVSFPNPFFSEFDRLTMRSQVVWKIQVGADSMGNGVWTSSSSWRRCRIWSRVAKVVDAWSWWMSKLQFPIRFRFRFQFRFWFPIPDPGSRFRFQFLKIRNREPNPLVISEFRSTFGIYEMIFLSCLEYRIRDIPLRLNIVTSRDVADPTIRDKAPAKATNT